MSFSYRGSMAISYPSPFNKFSFVLSYPTSITSTSRIHFIPILNSLHLRLKPTSFTSHTHSSTYHIHFNHISLIQSSRFQTIIMPRSNQRHRSSPEQATTRGKGEWLRQRLENLRAARRARIFRLRVVEREWASLHEEVAEGRRRERILQQSLDEQIQLERESRDDLAQRRRQATEWLIQSEKNDMEELVQRRKLATDWLIQSERIDRRDQSRRRRQASEWLIQSEKNDWEDLVQRQRQATGRLLQSETNDRERESQHAPSNVTQWLLHVTADDPEAPVNVEKPDVSLDLEEDDEIYIRIDGDWIPVVNRTSPE